MLPLKKAMLAFGLIAFMFAILPAQNFYKGDAYLHVGAALPYKIYEEDDRIQVPPILLTYEKAIMDNLLVGGTLGYTQSRSNLYRFIGDQYFHRHQYAIAMVRSTYHFDLLDPDKFDLYGGIGLGAQIGFASFVGDGNLADAGFSPTGAASGLLYTAFAGIHYYMDAGINLYAELGYKAFPVQIGLQFKL